VVNAMTKTDAIEGMSATSGRKPSTVLRQIGELDSVIREDSVDVIGYRRDKCLEKGGCCSHVGTLD
jgi:hypothetical protein